MEETQTTRWRMKNGVESEEWRVESEEWREWRMKCCHLAGRL